MSNIISAIFPYKENGLWMFDDAIAGLHKELFVSGADTIMDLISSTIKDGEKGFSLIFSNSPFPNYKFKAKWVREEFNGNWYYCEELNQEAWLCPALFKYFDEAPDEIYFTAYERSFKEME